LKMLRTRAIKFKFEKQRQLLEEVLRNKKTESLKRFVKKDSATPTSHQWTSKQGKVYRLHSRAGAIGAPKDVYLSLTSEDVSQLMERKQEEIGDEIINLIAKRTGTAEAKVASYLEGISENINYTEHCLAPEKVQINVRLSDENTKRINELCEYWKSKGELTFLHFRAKGSDHTVFSSTTSFGRFILESGIKHLYMDLKNEKDIEEIVDFICDHYSKDPELRKSALLQGVFEQMKVDGYPYDDDETPEEELQKRYEARKRSDENFNKMINASIKPNAYEIFKNKNGEKIAQKLFNKFW